MEASVQNLFRSQESPPTNESLLQAAHDIRSPLTALKIAIGALQEELPEAHRLVIKMALERIGNIADDLLLASPRPEQIMTVEAFAESIASVLQEKRTIAADLSGIELCIDASVENFGFVRAAPVTLVRMISNLVDNAIEAVAKVNDGRVGVRLSKRGDDLICEISDNGEGIAATDLPRLGQKGVSVGHHRRSGCGLGLYHARKSIEAWGGTLQIESRQGVGTNVRLSFRHCGR